MGAGLLPFCVHQGEVKFLLQTVFEGRKTGFFNDFGGGTRDGESYRLAAMREFVEETETLYFADDLANTQRSPSIIEAQVAHLQQLFQTTHEAHPDWYCRRGSRHPERPRDWTTFFVEIPHRDLHPLNHAWELDAGQRFKKRRQLFWISATELLRLYQLEPERLWKRVRQLVGAQQIIRDIQKTCGSS
jgi:hypothetical protein